MNRMDHIYGEYCKKHEDAACKLQELSSRPNVQAFLLVREVAYILPAISIVHTKSLFI